MKIEDWKHFAQEVKGCQFSILSSAWQSVDVSLSKKPYLHPMSCLLPPMADTTVGVQRFYMYE